MKYFHNSRKLVELASGRSADGMPTMFVDDQVCNICLIGHTNI